MRSTITVSGFVCRVERLSVAGKMHWERECSPKAEVFAPEGYEFSGGEPSLCVHTAADLDDIERNERLTEIEENDPNE